MQGVYTAPGTEAAAGNRLTRTINRGVAGWVRRVSARPRLALLVLSCLVLLAAVAATGLGMNTSTEDMLSRELPFQQRLDALDRAFPDEHHQIVIVVRSANRDAADAAVAELRDRLVQNTLEFMRLSAPSADPYLIAHGLLYLDEDSLDSQLSWLSKASNLIARLRVDQTFDGFLRALDEATRLAAGGGGEGTSIDPLYREVARTLAAQANGGARPLDWSAAFGTKDSEVTTRVITLAPRLHTGALYPAAKPLAAVQAAVAALDPALAAEVDIGVTGESALQADELASVTTGLGLSLLASLVMTALLLRIAHRSWARAGLAMTALGVTIVLTAGFAELAIGTLNLISIAFVVLMVGLGINYAIHFLVNYDAYRHGDADRREVSVATARAIGTPLFVSALTTTLAFLTFAFTDFVGMAQLGVIGGAGILIAFLVAITLIPAAIAVWPRLARGPRPQPLRPASPAVRRWALRGGVALGLAGLALVPFSSFDADPVDLRSASAPSMIAYGWLMEDPDLSPMKLNLVVPDPAAAAALAARLKALPEVAEATWLADLVPADQDRKLDLIDLARPGIEHAVNEAPIELRDEEAEAVTPETVADLVGERPGPEAAALARELRAYAGRRTPGTDRALGAAIFRFFPMLVDRLRLQRDADEVTEATLPAELRDRFVTADGRYRVLAAPSGNVDDPATMRAFVAAVDRVAPGAAGAPDQIVGAAGAVGRAMIEASALSLVGCILIARAVISDRIRLVGAVLPILLSASATIGAGVLLGLPFNYANVLVLPLMIGAGIDSGIFFSLRAGGRPGGSEADRTTAIGVFFGQVTTIASFASFALSDHPGTASMGILLAISIAVTLGMTFAVTPPIVEYARSAQGRAGATEMENA